MMFMGCGSMDIHASARDYRAAYRDGVMGVGPEGFAGFDYFLRHRMAGWEEANARNSHYDTQTQADKFINQERKTLQLEAHGRKHSASMPLPHKQEPKKAKTGSGTNDNRGTGTSSVDETGSGSRACTQTSSETVPVNRQFVTRTTPPIPEKDDSEPEIIEERPSTVSKRKASVTSTSDPAKKRAKHVETIDISDDEDEAEVRGYKSKAPKQKSTPVKATIPSKVARVQSVGPHGEEDESGEDVEEKEGEDKDEEETAAAEEANFAREISKAGQEFDSTCKRCKTSAEKALKSKYDLRISKIRSDHNHELRKHKNEAAKTLSDTKSKFDKEKKAAQQKYSDSIKGFKTSRDEKTAATKKSHNADLEKLQERYNKEKEKAAGLSRELEEANTKRKSVEKSAAQKVKDAKADLFAGETSLKEQKRQMSREMREEIDQLKPAHSKSIKEKDKLLKDMAEEVAKAEQKLNKSEDSLRDVRTEYAAEKQRHSNCKTELAQTKRHIADAEKDLKQCKAFAEKTQHRTETDKVRAKEKIELAIANRNEQNERLIISQRENYQLKDQMRTLAQRGREIRDELEKLKVELKSTKAELGVAKDMEAMDDALD